MKTCGGYGCRCSESTVKSGRHGSKCRPCPETQFFVIASESLTLIPGTGKVAAGEIRHLGQRAPGVRVTQRTAPSHHPDDDREDKAVRQARDPVLVVPVNPV